MSNLALQVPETVVELGRDCGVTGKVVKKSGSSARNMLETLAKGIGPNRQARNDCASAEVACVFFVQENMLDNPFPQQKALWLHPLPAPTRPCAQQLFNQLLALFLSKGARQPVSV